MEIREEGARAVAAILTEHNDGHTNEQLARLLMLAWLDGYKHGADTVHGMAEASFARLAEQFS